MVLIHQVKPKEESARVGAQSTSGKQGEILRLGGERVCKKDFRGFQTLQGHYIHFFS